MSGRHRQEKTPSEVLDFIVNFERWLETGDRITGASASITGGTTPATIDSTTYDDVSVKVWLSGGTDGDNSVVTVTATTLLGRTAQECFDLSIRNCT